MIKILKAFEEIAKESPDTLPLNIQLKWQKGSIATATSSGRVKKPL